MGYGSRALQSLNSFYSGELLNLDEVMAEMDIETFEDVAKVDEVGWLGQSDPFSRSLTHTITHRTPPSKPTRSASVTPLACLPSSSASRSVNPRTSTTSALRTVSLPCSSSSGSARDTSLCI